MFRLPFIDLFAKLLISNTDGTFPYARGVRFYVASQHQRRCLFLAFLGLHSTKIVKGLQDYLLMATEHMLAILRLRIVLG